VLEIISFQPELDTVLNYLDYDDPYLKKSERVNSIKKILGEEFRKVLEQTLLDHKLGYKMMTLSRKENK